MTLWQAIVLGATQGLTEFLPISSIAHMRLVSTWFGWDDPGAAFSAVVQLIAYLAVLLYFRRDCSQMARGLLRGVSTPDGKLGWMLIAGTIPIGLLGLLFHKRIEHQWRTIPVIAWALITLALVLALAEWTEHLRKKRAVPLRDLHELGWRDAIVVGCFQALALIPGASRSGSTITGGLFLGMKRDTAARFSFLLSLPAVLAAGLFELRKLHLSHAELLNVLVAGIVAFAVGYGAIVFLLGFLRRHSTWIFIVYRLVLGAVLLVVVAGGCGKPSGEKTQVPAKAVTPANPFGVLMGRWVRMDGGYQLMVHKVEADGKATVSYHNPSPIHVEQAQASREGDFTKLFVELRDEGYPGCTYRLRYDSLRDQLVGVYYQAALKESYEINFERQH